MRTLVFGTILLALSAVGLYPLISSAVAAHYARPATFSERFAPVLDQMKKPAGTIAPTG